ncbi:hypothetical protein QDT91_28495 (plasmid) [Mycolicibacterium aubagnense]|jgi:hypothetical protein|uniref:hypothetical protein n=1 Tax=Mycolicibacterium aubagnense TaxID=319707 RepID=UPI0013F5A93A|nr:hypothetical protein [Mycolicibacterium aubagnense]WGI35949.1 hypothetical protein QDT91_28495 [Mycolicibacterium aubagnense]
MAFESITLPAEELTLERLADFVDHARHAAAINDTPIFIDATDEHGIPVTVRNVIIEIDR